MNNRRYLWFFVSIVAGIAAGMIYGWYIRPAKASNLSLDALRADYRVDYVLMVAEAYQSADDAALAISYLLKLGEGTPLQLVQEVLVTAQDLGYSQQDIQLLANLASNLQQSASIPGGGGAP